MFDIIVILCKLNAHITDFNIFSEYHNTFFSYAQSSLCYCLQYYDRVEAHKIIRCY